jgi:AraC-like DNA-binding protein
MVPIEQARQLTGVKVLDTVVDGLIASALRTKAPGHRSHTNPKLSATVQKLTGLTLPELRMHWHMQVARDLLRYTDLPLQEVMQRCGYTSMPTFSRTVRRWWGVSPQHLRILARNRGDIGKYAL